MPTEDTIAVVETKIKKFAKKMNREGIVDQKSLIAFTKLANTYQRLPETQRRENGHYEDRREIPKFSDDEIAAMSEEEINQFGDEVHGNPLYIVLLSLKTEESESRPNAKKKRTKLIKRTPAKQEEVK